MDLRFVRFASTNPDPGPPIVYLAGGPGGSGIATAQGSRFGLFMRLRSVADVIAFDQRGTGRSDQPPAYPEIWTYPFGEPLDRQRVADTVAAYTRAAADFWREQGVDLTAYHTNESADDLNDLRRALGAEKISLWSISYGSHLALATLRRHGPHLDRVILAGVEGPDHTVKLPSATQQLLVRIDSLLKADAATAAVFPDFLGDLRTLLDRLAAEPVTINAFNYRSGQSVPLTLGKFEMQILLANSLRGPETFARLPYQIHEMLAGDFSGISRWALFTHTGDARAMPLAMDVASGISPEREQRVRREAAETLLGGAINFPYFAQRRALPELDLGPDFRAPVVSEVPVLCISGTLDGRTAPGNATETLRTLPNGRHLLIEGAGHSDPLFLSDPRIAEIMERFLAGAPVEDQRIVLPPVEWFLGEE